MIGVINLSDENINKWCEKSRAEELLSISRVDSHIIQKYNNLSRWKKFELWSGAASIVGFIFAVVVYIFDGSPNPHVPSDNTAITVTSDVNINWSDVQEYFKLKDVNFKRGFKKGVSVLTFVVQAKGDFTGELYYQLKDSFGIPQCITNIACDSVYLKEENYNDQPSWQTGNRKNYSYWKKNETDRGTIYLPYDTHTVQINFEQFYLK